MKVYKIFFIILISNFVLGQENNAKDATLNYFEESTPEKEGLDSRYILNFIQKAENEIDELHSLMIIKNGKNIASGTVSNDGSILLYSGSLDKWEATLAPRNLTIDCGNF